MVIKTQPPCPECEKLAAVSEDSNKIGNFIEWLRGTMGMDIAIWENERLVEADYRGDYGINRLLAQYYGIDLDKVEEERRALLEWLREVQK